jgi:hypothetical protein
MRTGTIYLPKWMEVMRVIAESTASLKIMDIHGLSGTTWSNTQKIIRTLETHNIIRTRKIGRSCLVTPLFDTAEYIKAYSTIKQSITTRKYTEDGWVLCNQ